MAVKSPYAPGGRYGTRTTSLPIRVRPAPAPRPPAAWKGLEGQLRNVFGGDPYAGEQAAIGYGWSQGLANDVASGGRFGGGYVGGPPDRVGRLVSPDYSGILSAYTNDARARFGAGLESMKAQRLSQARAAINKLGVRDVPGLLAKVQQYGLTQADLQGAADNPWSELKALDFLRNKTWANTVAERASRGGYRSGGTVGARTRLENEAARQEGLLTQNTLADLGQGLFEEKEWERQNRDAMEQAAAQYQAQLAQAYQPYWVYD